MGQAYRPFVSVGIPHPRSDSITAVQDSLPTTLAELWTQLESMTLPKQLQRIKDIAATGESGTALLQDVLRDRPTNLAPLSPKVILFGTVYQQLANHDSEDVVAWLLGHCPTGVVPLRSERSIDYLPIQQSLAQKEFELADRLTVQKMCELAGPTAIARKWLYFTEVDNFPATDLLTINALWLAHSEGNFGFSVQRELWLGVGRNWDALWPKIGWRSGNIWTRYPNEFIWDLSAPRGHLPLTNQLRGVRVMASLMQHPAWSTAP